MIVALLACSSPDVAPSRSVEVPPVLEEPGPTALRDEKACCETVPARLLEAVAADGSCTWQLRVLTTPLPEARVLGRHPGACGAMNASALYADSTEVLTFNGALWRWAADGSETIEGPPLGGTIDGVGFSARGIRVATMHENPPAGLELAGKTWNVEPPYAVGAVWERHNGVWEAISAERVMSDHASDMANRVWDGGLGGPERAGTRVRFEVIEPVGGFETLGAVEGFEGWEGAEIPGAKLAAVQVRTRHRPHYQALFVERGGWERIDVEWFSVAYSAWPFLVLEDDLGGLQIVDLRSGGVVFTGRGARVIR